MMAKTVAHALRRLANRIDPPDAGVTEEQLDKIREIAEAKRMLQHAEAQAEIYRLGGHLPTLLTSRGHDRHW